MASSGCWRTTSRSLRAASSCSCASCSTSSPSGPSAAAADLRRVEPPRDVRGLGERVERPAGLVFRVLGTVVSGFEPVGGVSMQSRVRVMCQPSQVWQFAPARQKRT